MTKFYAKTINYMQGVMLNICDANLIDKEIHEADLTMRLSGEYYGSDLIDRAEAVTLLQNSHIINMAGDEITSLSISMGLGTKSGVRRIRGVPFLILFKG